MNIIIRTRNSIVQSVLLTLVFILGLSSIAWGAEFWLRTETLTKTMPDTSVVTMWGFAQCTDGTYATCNQATVPGPRLTVPAGETVLTINLRNNLTGLFVEPVSIVIPGQAILPAPVRNTDGRVRSFTTETPPDNATTVIYTWNNIKPGTYLYESGTHPAVQVQMGLYGAVTNDTAAGQVYGPGTAYDNEAILLFSEIDPVLHGHVAAGTYGTPPPAGITSTINYEPRYFLVNGEPYPSGASDIVAGLEGQNVLLRFLSAGLKQRVPTIKGLRMSVVAENGNPYLYPKDQYSILLSPGKTMDAMVMADPGGRFPVFDRRLGLKNNALSSGGMLAFLEITAPPRPYADISPVMLPFGFQMLGAPSGAMDVTLFNTGNAVLDISSIAITGANSGDFSFTTTCGTSLAAGTDCTISVIFTPTVIGARSADLVINSNDLLAPTIVIPLSGTGSFLRVLPSTLVFDAQLIGSKGAEQAVTVTNLGPDTVIINSVTLTGANTADFQLKNKCKSSLPAGSSCSINIKFSPTAAGTRVAAISVSYVDPTSPQTVLLSGTGVVGPAVVLIPASLSFGNVTVGTTSGPLTITLMNTGDASLIISEINSGGSSEFASTNNCPIGGGGLALAAGCTFNVTFTPTKQGNRKGKVVIKDNAAAGSKQQVTFSGIGQ